MADNEDSSFATTLSISVKAMNDTPGPSGLVSTLLLFGILPRIPVRPTALPKQTKRMELMHSAKMKMMAILSQAGLQTALNSAVPTAADNQFRVGDEVLMYREKPVNKWIGPYIVVDKNEKFLTLNTGDRHIRSASDRVKAFKLPPGPSTSDRDSTLLLDSSFPDLSKIIHDIIYDPITMEELDQPVRSARNNLKIHTPMEDSFAYTPEDRNVHLTDILDRWD